MLFAEKRFEKADGHGVLFTNGTGTGKTYTQLGVAKRFHKDGLTNILIVVPGDTHAKDMIEAAGNLNMPLKQLESASTHGDSGPIVTTYANFGSNDALADRQWDLILVDESHKLMSSQDGTTTNALQRLRAVSLHPDGLFARARAQLRSEWNAWDAREENDTPTYWSDYNALKKRTEELARSFAEQPRAKVVFLSATPFPYVFSVEYANGYLFDWGRDEGGRGYNDASARGRFFIQHFGFRMRYGKLTQPDAKVNSEVMERQFNTWLKQQGALRGRMLEVEADYDRRFVQLSDRIGEKIDEGIKYLWDNREQFPGLADQLRRRFDYLARIRTLEALKAQHAPKYIQQHLDKGRKVVVFHDLVEPGQLTHPFRFSPFGEVKEETIAKFEAARPDLVKLPITGLKTPIQSLTKAFPNALVFNGRVPKKDRVKAKKLFNTDGSGYDVIIVQRDAGREGLSLHDVTGKHQRVLVDLGLPMKPIDAIQTEGRIRRNGVVSNQLMRYFSTGTDFERYTFASKIAERASTAENLAMGESARALKQAFIEAYEDAGDFTAGHDGEGVGGKEADRASSESAKLSDWDRATSFYFGQGKKRGRRDQREGADYYATPEPVGLKMVEWAGIKPGDDVLEPSVGHGAIARWVPESANLTIIDDSLSLLSKAKTVAGHATDEHGKFEDHHIVNKYDAIVMNPPYGHGGSIAIPHLIKATEHLKDGGRVVALIPEGGSADKRFNDWYAGEKNKYVYLVASVSLPSVTFERAGTAVKTRIVVLEKHYDEQRPQLQRPFAERDLSNAESADELFKRLENMELPERVPLGRNGTDDAALASASTGTGAGMGRREAWAQAAAFVTPLRDFGAKLVVVQSASELPTNVLQATAEGGYQPSTNTVYLIADNLTPDRLQAVLQHEILVHYGLRKMLTRVQFTKLRMQILEAARQAAPASAMGKLWARVQREYADKPEWVKAEEMLARIAETQPEGMRETLLKWLGQIARWLRENKATAWLFADRPITTFELRAILAKSRAELTAPSARAEPSTRSPTDFASVSDELPPLPDVEELDDSDALDAMLRNTDPQGDESLAATVLKLLAQTDELFQYPKSTHKDLIDIAADTDPGLAVEHETKSPHLRALGEYPEYSIRMPDGAMAYVFQKGKEVWINAALLEEGKSRGSALYAAVANYAHNNGLVFVDDPAGLSAQAQVRRVEHMLSSAVKFGTTRHLYPGEPTGTKWRHGDDAYNMRSLIEKSTANIFKAVPDLKHVRYDFDQHTFIDSRTGQRADLGYFADQLTGRKPNANGPSAGSNSAGQPADARGNPKARSGSATVARAALLASLEREEGGQVGGASRRGRNGVLAEVVRQLRAGLDDDLQEVFYSRRQESIELPGWQQTQERSPTKQAGMPMPEQLRQPDRNPPIEDADTGITADPVPLWRRLLSKANDATAWAVLQLVPVSRLKDFAPKGMTAAAEFDQIRQDIDAWRTKQTKQFAAAADRWAAFILRDKTGSQKLAELMHDATIYGFDPSVAGEYVPTITREEAEQQKAVIKARMKDNKEGRREDYAELENIDAQLAFELKRRLAADGLRQRFAALPSEAQTLFSERVGRES